MTKLYNRAQVASVLSSIPAEQRAGIRAIFFPQIIRTSVDRYERGNGNKAVRRSRGTVVRWGSLQCQCDASPCAHEWIYERQSERREEHRNRRGVKSLLSRQFPI